MIRFALAGGKPQSLSILGALESKRRLPSFVFEAPDLPEADRVELRAWCSRRGVAIDTASAMTPELLAKLDVLLLCRFALVPEAMFSAPRLGTLNVHSSLLPKYRGVHPVSWALIDDARSTGVTIHRVDAGIDTGAIVGQHELAIRDDHDLHSLTSDLDRLSGELAIEVFETMIRTRRVPVGRPQVGTASRAPRRGPDDGRIDWSRRARDVFNLVRALPAPLPPAFTYVDGRRVDVATCRLADEAPRGQPGWVYESNDRWLSIRCGDGRAVAVDASAAIAVGACCQ